VFWSAGFIVGLSSERVRFGWDGYTSWIPDLVVGLVFFGCAARAVARDRGTAVLLAAVGSSWFLANHWVDALFVHRAVLIHLLVVYPGWRPRSRLGVAAMIAGYAAALYLPVWRSDAMAIALASAVVGVVAIDTVGSSGRLRRARQKALVASVILGITIIAGAGLRWALDEQMSDVVPLLYQGALCCIALVVTAGLPAREMSSIVDLVVELDETRSGTLRDALATTLGDPTLEVGYWDRQASYVNAEGRVVDIPSRGASRSPTFVERESRPFAVLVHDASILNEPLLVEAVAAATRLSEVNAELQAKVRDQVAALTASRRRLVSTADEERRRLGERLQAGAECHLRTLDDLLRREVGDDGLERVERATTLLAETMHDLRQLADGLHPRELDDGLAAALRSLAGRCPIPVVVIVDGEEPEDDAGTAAYYVCAEALANTIKHSGATRAWIRVLITPDRVTIEVADDGAGGAETRRGSGLRGLIDRVEAIDGTLDIGSPVGGGTRLLVDIPGVAPRPVEPVGHPTAGRNRQRREERTRHDAAQILDPHDRSHPIMGGSPR
jgi:signal transduction histidine kinase